MAFLVTLSVFSGHFTYNHQIIIQFKLQWEIQKNLRP